MAKGTRNFLDNWGEDMMMPEPAPANPAPKNAYDAFLEECDRDVLGKAETPAPVETAAPAEPAVATSGGAFGDFAQKEIREPGVFYMKLSNRDRINALASAYGMKNGDVLDKLLDTYFAQHPGDNMVPFDINRHLDTPKNREKLRLEKIEAAAKNKKVKKGGKKNGK